MRGDPKALPVLLIPLILRLTPGDTPSLRSAAFDARVVVGAIGLSIVMWLVVGLLPALRAGRTDLNQTLKGGESGGLGGWSGRVLVVSQPVIATALVSGTGTLAHTFYRLSTLEPGFDANHL